MTQLPTIGKISPAVFESLIYSRLGYPRNDVLVGPQSGVDVSIVELPGGAVLAATCDPVFIVPQYGFRRAAWFAVHILASDAAMSGLTPAYLAIDLNLPLSITEDELTELWDGVHETCRELGIAIVSGHTARYEGCAYPMVGGATVLAVGAADRYVTANMAAQAMSSSAPKAQRSRRRRCLAATFPEALAARIGPELAAAARCLFEQMTVVEDARIACAYGVRDAGVTSLHDATEGGVLGGVVEIAQASGVGVRFDEQAVPIRPETTAVCELVGIDPLAAISEGTLLATVRPQHTDGVLALLREAGIVAAVIGEMVSAERGLVRLTRRGRAVPRAPRHRPLLGGFRKGHGVRPVNPKEPASRPARILTIAGSDSGGGAGIEADLKTIERLGGYGMAAVTAVTAQNTLGVFGVWPLPLEAVRRQIEVVAADIGIDAVKIGMLGSAEVVRGVAASLRELGPFTVVLDPVMVAKGGDQLLETDALDALRLELLPLATLVTPNLPEAETLTDLPAGTRPERERAARRLVEMGAGAALIKGGHGDGPIVEDLLYDGREFSVFQGERLSDPPHARHRLHPLLGDRDQDRRGPAARCGGRLGHPLHAGGHPPCARARQGPGAAQPRRRAGAMDLSLQALVDRERVPAERLERWLGAAAAGGVTGVQLREKGAVSRASLLLRRARRPTCPRAWPLVLRRRPPRSRLGARRRPRAPRPRRPAAGGSASRRTAPGPRAFGAQPRRACLGAVLRAPLCRVRSGLADALQGRRLGPGGPRGTRRGGAALLVPDRRDRRHPGRQRSPLSGRPAWPGLAVISALTQSDDPETTARALLAGRST